MTEQEVIIDKIATLNILNSKNIWKFLTEENMKEVEKSFGVIKREKLFNWLFSPDRKCEYCENKTVFQNFNQGYRRFCSAQCASQWYRENETVEQLKLRTQKMSKGMKSRSIEEWEATIRKQKETKLERYGDENFNNLEKQQETMLEKHGQRHPLQVKKFNEKFKKTLEEKDWSDSVELRKQTLLEFTGYDNPAKNPVCIEKRKQTMIENYGVENPSQLPEIKLKKIETHQKNYGVDFPSQYPETFEKQRNRMYAYKTYLTPQGKILKIQGYEGWALDALFTIHAESEIITEAVEMPEIWYVGTDFKYHRYIPDIFIQTKNKIIEVKSFYTMQAEYEKNILKKNRCLEMGFDFEFMIYDEKMNLIPEEEFKS